MNIKHLTKTPFSWAAATFGAASYGGFMYDFVMASQIGSYIGYSALGLFGASVIGGVTYISLNKNKIEQREKEKEYNSLKENIKHNFGHLELNNVFEKVETIKNLIKESTSTSSLFYSRMLGLINHSLEMYIQNLELISKYQKVLKIEDSELYKDEINKNQKQNEELVSKIDFFIQEFLKNQNNDDRIGDILKEYERNMNIYDEISNIRKNS